MVKAKPNQKNHLNQLESAFDKLDSLENKPQEKFTLRETVVFLRDKLESALKKGYSYQDLSEVLAEQKIIISAATLKQYLTEISKKSSSRRKRKTKSSSNAQSSSVSSRNSNSKSVPQSSPKLSTNVTSFEEELAPGFSHSEINKIKKVEPSEQIVNLDSTSRTKLSRNNDKQVSNDSPVIGKGSKTVTKAKVLSGLDDDLSSEFNSF